jgi:hypothetical protein
MKDAQKSITRWKFGTIYIYSTPSIPTTETTHGLYEEEFSEKIVYQTQEIASQGSEEAGQEAREKARRQEARQEARQEEKEKSPSQERQAEGSPQEALGDSPR